MALTEKNIERARELNRLKSARRRAANPEKVREDFRKWRAQNPRPSRAGRTARIDNLRYNYGITPEKYDEMLSSQNGRCAICQSEDPKHKGSFFCVDHDHETGAVRALLCSPCNTRIGLLEHDSLPKLLDYMERFYGLDSN